MQMLQHAHATVPAGDRVQLTTCGVHAAAGLIAPGGAPPSAPASSSWGLLRVAASERSVGRRAPSRMVARALLLMGEQEDKNDAMFDFLKACNYVSDFRFRWSSIVPVP